LDKHPSHSAFAIGRLQDNGHQVITCTDLNDALQQLRAQPRLAIISTGSALLDGTATYLDGFQRLNSVNADTPVLVYASPATASKIGPELTNAGAALVTSSPYELTTKLAWLNLL
jgi:DNA-binding response OmpR family regulator